MSKLEEITKQFADAFETRKRDNGEEFFTLRDGSPAWMIDVCHEAHGDMPPDDWRYRMIREVARELEDIAPEDWPGRQHEVCDGLVPIWNAERAQWFASSIERQIYCDQAAEEGLIGDDRTIAEWLGIGMYCEYQEVYSLLTDALHEQAGDEEPEPADIGLHVESELLMEDLPQECIEDCSAPGSVDDAVAHWRQELGFTVDRDNAIACLRGYGAWDDLDDADDETLAQRVLFLACGTFHDFQVGGPSSGSDIFALEG